MASGGDSGDSEWRGAVGGVGGGATCAAGLVGGATGNGAVSEVGEGENGIGEGSLVSLTFSSFMGWLAVGV